MMLSQENTIAQTARLRQALTWLAAICLATTPFDLVAGLLLNNTALLVLGAIAFSVGSMAIVSIFLAGRGRLSAAVLTISITIIILALILMVVFPALTTALTMVPLLIIALMLPYLPSRTILIISIVAVPLSIIIFLIGTLLPPIMAPPPPTVALVLGVVGIAVVGGITLLLLWQFSTQLLANLHRTNEINTALEQARADLEGQVAMRTADLRGVLADVQARAEAQAQLLDENTQQRNAIREMSVPILPVSAEAIVIPLIGALDSHRLRIIQEQALQAISQSSARYVLLDITGVSVVDTQVAQGLMSVVQAARLLGAEVILVGVRPEVAQTVVSLGMDLSGVPTRQSLREGIAYTTTNVR
jgi:rsbT co-antagonist protein RsbR